MVTLAPNQVLPPVCLSYQRIDDGYLGPKPSGGVGGTRRGVKCLHAHVANFLATKNDVIGQWAIEKIDEDNKSKSITSNESI